MKEIHVQLGIEEDNKDEHGKQERSSGVGAGRFVSPAIILELSFLRGQSIRVAVNVVT